MVFQGSGKVFIRWIWLGALLIAIGTIISGSQTHKKIMKKIIDILPLLVFAALVLVLVKFFIR